jgi:hypothetical protein
MTGSLSEFQFSEKALLVFGIYKQQYCNYMPAIPCAVFILPAFALCIFQIALRIKLKVDFI